MLINTQSQVRTTSKFDITTKSHSSATIAECLQNILNITMFASKLTHHTIHDTKNNKFRQECHFLTKNKMEIKHTNFQSKQVCPKPF